MFIEKRDGHPCDPKNIFMTNGASDGVNMVLRAIIKQRDDGVLIPIPQYPLYSALIQMNQCQ